LFSELFFLLGFLLGLHTRWWDQVCFQPLNLMIGLLWKSWLRGFEL